MIFASIIIPTCNRTHDLRLCVEKLVTQLPADGSVELIVTDDGATAASRDMLAAEFPAVRWVQGPRLGPAANRNRGAVVARGEWLIFLDDDLLPEPGLVPAYLAAMRPASASLCVLEGATRRDPQPPSLLWEAPQKLRALTYLSCSCNFAIRSATYRLMEGFDERYRGGVYAEDTDLSARLTRAGYEVQFVPDAKAVHPLRPVPDVAKLARRWEGKVIFAFDQGASGLTVAWRLPWHALRVIQSRFRGQHWSSENRRALMLFLGEWFLVLCQTPGWVWKWMSAPRSRFWRSNARPLPKFGF
ncbi:MAG: glycosyltransferase [Prosthecobacter sp.]|jgi:GT2 family glycosyltransferase|uniref:glycosyltransferase family 2 protein n=1 Tax=Prosthecobacter sp. TaxID=1965333 RepID=UPI0019EBB3E7|nr:glycosyltransferase [Prosthecobacter sp.]MBE2286299.1 glycosyltransferase [Prosthecobacter sp.]